MERANRRILRDVQQVMAVNRESLENQGIYYLPDESNSMKGIALLVGQSDTPYFGGFYFFSVDFPSDYPFSPIKVLSLTQDGKTRFNPNLYIQGKVCLSILNTWHDGPQWTGVQSLESVLLAIMSDVLCENPLENEPAYRGSGLSEDAKLYNRLIWYANVKTAIYEQLHTMPSYAVGFRSILFREFEKHKDRLLLRIADSTILDGKTEHSRVFSLSHTYQFLPLVEKLKDLKNLMPEIPTLDS